jgi:hypothetical protein
MRTMTTMSFRLRRPSLQLLLIAFTILVISALIFITGKARSSGDDEGEHLRAATKLTTGRVVHVSPPPVAICPVVDLNFPIADERRSGTSEDNDELFLTVLLTPFNSFRPPPQQL